MKTAQSLYLNVLLGASMVILGSSAQAAQIDIFNTGVDAAGTPRAHDSVNDLHYTLTAVPGGTMQTKVLTAAGGFPIGPWLGDSALSAWIGPNTSQADGPAGDYTYRTTFDLTGLDPDTAVLTGRWSTDNSGTNIFINGAATGNTASGFGQWFNFTINSGFVAGLNSLDFVVNNGGGPTGLRVEISGTADFEESPVPEPASVICLASGLAFVVLHRRNRFSELFAFVREKRSKSSYLGPRK